MEEQRNLNAAAAGSFHLAALSRQNISDIACDLGRLDSVDGHYLFAAACAPIPVVRTRAFVLGLTPDLYDESLRRKGGSRRADCAGDYRRIGAVHRPPGPGRLRSIAPAIKKKLQRFVNARSMFPLRHIATGFAHRRLHFL